LNRLTSYGFIFIVIILAILEGSAEDHALVIKGLALALFIAYSAFFLTWLTLDAVLPVVILGTIILGFGGWILAIAVIVFFITGSLLSRLNLDRTPSAKETGYQVRRDGIQIWANGFWIAIFCIFWFLSNAEIFLAAAFAAVATAMADTWATEIGVRNPGKTISILTRKKVEPGTDGGISLKGTVASFIGAILIGFFASQGIQSYPAWTFAVITLAGFSGCMLDSYLGALYHKETGELSEVPVSDRDAKENQNNLVNWISTGSGGIIALLLLLIF